jgi:hypothetical protein
VYALLVLDFERSAEGWRAAMLIGAALLWLAFVPALAAARAGNATDRIRDVDSRILLRTIGALLYAAALFAGLALALGAVNTLFELGLRSSIYAHVFGWIFLVLAPWIVIGGLPDYARPVDDSAVAGVAHRMTAFLVPPLLAIYCAILYAYVIRIGLTGEIPKNLLSPMVLAAGALGGLGLFLFEPRPAGEEQDAVRTAGWLRAAPPLFLPLAVLGLWAVGLRVDQYGWTEFRLLRVLLLAVLAVLAAGATFQLVQRRRFALHIVPLALCVVMVAGAVGPWGVIAISRRSQQAALAGALRMAGIEPDVPLVGMPAAAEPVDTLRPIPNDLYQRINDSARYLTQHHGPNALPPVLAERAAAGASAYDLAASLGLQRAAPPPGVDGAFNGHFGDAGVTDVRGMSVHRFTVHPEGGRATSGAVTMEQDSTRLLVHVGGRRLSGDLSQYMSAFHPVDSRGEMLNGDEARIRLTDSEGRSAGDVLILQIGMVTRGGVMRLRQLDGLLFIDAPPDTTR